MTNYKEVIPHKAIMVCDARHEDPDRKSKNDRTKSQINAKTHHSPPSPRVNDFARGACSDQRAGYASSPRRVYASPISDVRDSEPQPTRSRLQLYPVTGTEKEAD